MHLPKLHGSFNQTDFFIYVACDTQYFDEFAVNLVNSIDKNSGQPIHIHIFNPRDDQLARFSENTKISTTYEYVKLEDFISATKNLEKSSQIEEEKFKHERSLNAMQKGHDKSLVERVMKTYFACARFIRLGEIVLTPQQILAIDIDAIVRKRIIAPAGDYDFFIHHITGRKARFLAGGMFFLDTDQSLNYLKEYASVLKDSIEKDHLYWSLDQDVLDTIVPNYRYGQLPLSYIDWNMQNTSCVWTAKGERKNLPIFLNEKKQYNS